MNRREILAALVAVAAVPAAADGPRQITDPITVEGLRDRLQELLDGGLDPTTTMTTCVDGRPSLAGPLVLRTLQSVAPMLAVRLSGLHWQRQPNGQTVVTLG